MKKYYAVIRALHLYLGLFISPFILIFSIGVLVNNNPGLMNRLIPVKDLPVVKTKLNGLSYEGSDLETAKLIIRKLNINGEIDFISRNDQFISFPVNKPGLRTFIKVNLNTDSVLITRNHDGALRSMAYLHMMPGPHNVKMRGNSGFIKLWRVLADFAVYILLFLLASGVFMWVLYKTERVIGIYALSVGGLLFIGFCVLILYSH